MVRTLLPIETEIILTTCSKNNTFGCKHIIRKVHILQ